jgi:hypothetical protein
VLVKIDQPASTHHRLVKPGIQVQVADAGSLRVGESSRKFWTVHEVLDKS